ncbi:MAG: (d)CMP kinase [Chloroflexota bacterium]|nr:(d)CMP kinase [Chloroflexota bacterium]
MSIPECIAIDGPAASGKSTVANKISQKIGYLYFDTGVMYRAVTWLTLRHEVSFGDENAVSALAENIPIDVNPPSVADGRDCDIFVEGEDITWKIRLPEVDANVSIVSVYPGVRAALTAQQRRIGLQGQVVMVGRDIGTMVLPEAELKIYLDASAKERARRRYQERLERGEEADFEVILENVRRRDKIDSTREVAPLKAAKDAVIIDTNDLTIEDVLAEVERLISQFEKAKSKKSPYGDVPR